MIRIRAIQTLHGAHRLRTPAGAIHFDEAQGGIARVPEPLALELEAEGRVRIPYSAELTHGNFLLRRRSGLGDVICLSPVVAALQEVGAKCRVICHPNYQEMWRGVVGNGDLANEHWRVVLFQGWLEQHPGRKDRPAALCYGDWWNLPDLEDARPLVVLSDEERAWGEAQVRGLVGAEKGAAVALFSRAGWETRTYRHFLRVAKSLADQGCGVLGFDGEVLPCCKRPQLGLTARQLAAVIAACDLVVSGDSGPMHLAAAVGTPAVAVFCASSAAGSVGPGYDVVALEPEGLACWPCWQASCAEGDLDIPGSCVDAVSPERVVQVALERLRAPSAISMTNQPRE